MKTRKCLDRIDNYVPGKPIDEVKREMGLSDVVKLASNENPLGPSQLALAALRKAVEEVHIYPDGNCYYLKQGLARVHQLTPENFLVGNGSDGIIKMLAETFVSADEEVIVPDPSFSEYIFATRLLEGNEVKVPLDKSYTCDLRAMLAALNERTRMIYICSPNNPTGTVNSKRQMDAFLAKVPQDVIVVIDAAYCEYAESEDYTWGGEYISQYPNVVVLRTFSKIYGLAGLRVGYAMADAALIAKLHMAREPFNSNSLALAGALAALDDDAHVEASRKLNSEGKRYLYAEFEKLGMPYIPTEANFIMVDVGMDSVKLFQELLKRGVIVRTGNIFGMDNWVRVTIGNAEENARFIRDLKEITGR